MMYEREAGAELKEGDREWGDGRNLNPQVLLCSSRRGQNIVSMVNKTESFFRPPQQLSPPSSALLPPPLMTCCFLPATIVCKCEVGDITVSSCKQV